MTTMEGYCHHKPKSHKTIYNKAFSATSTTFQKLIYISIFLIIIIDKLTGVSAERFHRFQGLQHAYHVDNDNSRSKFTITKEDQCRNYLCKYGYLNCNCSQYLSSSREDRRKRDIQDFQSIIPVEEQSESPDNSRQSMTPPTLLTTPNSQACTNDHFRRAYQKFQDVYRLNITGVCDERTMSFMSQSRCGQPDIFDVDEIMEKERSWSQILEEQLSPRVLLGDLIDDRPKRATVSLREIINIETEADRSITRRKQILDQYLQKQESEHRTYDNGGSVRIKRSFLSITINEFGGLMNKQRISWRLMGSYISPQFPASVQNAVLMQAFRYWSEVTPLCFEEKKNTPHVDIEIGFVEGVHLNCFKQFDGYGGEIAHKFIRDVHFDKTEPYSIDSTDDNTISLQLVAVHEIGHVLGFNHSILPGSVMNAIYHRNIKGKFELTDHDRAEAKKAYGSCNGRFDLVFDFVRNQGSTRMFNTFFFRDDHFWMYENKNKRPRFGDPLQIPTQWTGLPTNMDAYVHYFQQIKNPPSTRDEYYFFKGDKFYQYSESNDRVIDQGLIRSKFRNGPKGSIPNNLDTAFYDFLGQKILFFKGDMVYKYAYQPTGDHSCCSENPQKITDVFPPKSPSDLRSPSGETYTRDLDAVYFSWSSPFPLYLIKGNSAWIVEGYSPIVANYNEANLKVKYVSEWNQIWQYICDADCPQ